MKKKLVLSKTHNHTETSLQDIVMPYLLEKTHHLIVPNVKLFWWESDIISVTRSGLIHELEIKCSRQDFLNDKNKRKWKVINSGNSKLIPNYYWYILPQQFVYSKEIPDFAGIVFVNSFNEVKEIKKPKLLHNCKIDDLKRDYLSRGLLYRHLKYRLMWNKDKLS